MPLKYCTGYNPSPRPPVLKFASYFKAVALPAVPQVYGHQGLIPAKGWGMLANDSVGDCTVAGPMHIIMLWNKIAGRDVSFTDTDALADYSAITGYKSSDPNTDSGADPNTVAQYWKSTGFIDNSGVRHKIVAELEIDASNLPHLDAAAYLFDGGVGLGVNLPNSAEDQFDAGQPWTLIPNDSIDGGHYIPMLGRDDQGIRHIITWGQDQGVQEDWLRAYLMEAVAYVSEEFLVAGKSPEGFDLAALQSDLEALA